MTLDRLEKLYRQPLVRSETAKKQLPLKHILEKKLRFFPEKPKEWAFDFLEIGPGTGDFLFHLAELNPKAKILAIEIGGKRFQKISERLIKRGINNVTLIHGDARIVFHKLLPDESITKCYVLFPDPWPKNCHRHRRLLQADFCKLIAKKIRIDGEITLATDVGDYAKWVFDNLSKIASLKPESDAGHLKTPPPDIIPTYFKKKWEERGRDFWYVRFKKPLP